MRVTGGKLRGQQIIVPKKSVRPISDRVRAAVFSSVLEVIPGALVLDVFAGSGALGFEALSRGAAFICWVEADSKVVAVLRKNVTRLCSKENISVNVDMTGKPISPTKVVKDDAIRFLQCRTFHQPFDIMFADPPYGQAGYWLKKLLPAVSSGFILKHDGLFIFEQDKRTPLDSVEGWLLLKTRVYGETQVSFWKQE